MSNQSYRQQTIELDYKEIIWKLLQQWKALLLIALLVAGLMAGAKYRNDQAAYNAAVQAKAEEEAQSTLPVDERIEMVLQTLADSERDSVMFVVSEKEWLNHQYEYIHDSILMKTDPTNQRVLKMVYDIDCDDSDLPALDKQYKNYIFSETVIDALQPVIDPKASKEYIGELFYMDPSEESASEPVDAAIAFNIVLPEEADAGEVEKIITKEIKAYEGSIQGKYPHSITLAGADDVHIFHSDNVKKRRDLNDNINVCSNAIKNTTQGLSAAQNAAIDKIVKIKAESETTGAADAEVTAEQASIPVPGVNKKHLILGFMLGLCLYALVYVVLLFFKGCVNSVDEAERYTGFRVLGDVYYIKEAKGIKKLLQSKKLANLHYKKSIYSSQQIGYLAETIKAMCSNEGIKEVDLITFEGSKRNGSAEANGHLETIISNLTDRLKELGIRLNRTSVGEEINEGQFLDMQNALVVVSDGTKASNLNKLTALLTEYKINKLGGLYIGEI